MSTLLDRVLPPAAGEPFRRLALATWSVGLGDGIALVALPLLAATLTHEPLVVALVFVLQRLPFLLLAPYAATLADRTNRRTLVVAGDLVRIAVLAALAMTLLTGSLSTPGLLGAAVVLGVAETFVDTTSSSLPAMLLADGPAREPAERRLRLGVLIGSQLAGPALGALLFVVAPAAPLLVQALLLGIGIRLLSLISLPGPDRRTRAPRVRHRFRPLISWIGSRPDVRTLTGAALAAHMAGAAGGVVLVLYTLERLDAAPIGFALLATAPALGALAGAVLLPHLEGRLTLAALIRLGLAVEVLCHGVLALALGLLPAALALAVFGANAWVWGTVASERRRSEVPAGLAEPLARLHLLGVVGALVVGGLLGGALADRAGLVAPYWAGAAGTLLLLGALWGPLGRLDPPHATPVVPRDDGIRPLS